MSDSTKDLDFTKTEKTKKKTVKTEKPTKRKYTRKTTAKTGKTFNPLSLKSTKAVRDAFRLGQEMGRLQASLDQVYSHLA